MRSVILTLSLVWGSVSYGADILEGPIPEEVASFRSARVRFSERMQEFNRDTLAFVNYTEQEERAKLVGSFDSRLSHLEEAEKLKRDEAVAEFEQFLVQYPNNEFASHVRFRLADLLFEVATAEWFEDQARYQALADDPNLSLEDLEKLGDEPRRDLTRPIALYERIIKDNKASDKQYEFLDAVYVMLGFAYMDQSSGQYDVEKAKGTFRDLIVDMPDSELADRGHLFLGNFLFYENQYDEALAEYKAVLDKGEESKYYIDSLYQLGWAKYKLNDFQLALEYFSTLLRLSEEKHLQTGEELGFAPDARRFMAFSFADIALENFKDALPVAEGYFTKLGNPGYERAVYIELADVLQRYGALDQAMEVLRKLQNDPRWVNEPDNPTHQIRIVQLLQGPLRDLESAGAERLALTNQYGLSSTWYKANLKDPEALQVAREFIERSLLDVAIELNVNAQNTGSEEHYAAAAEKYREYLETFPMADDYYQYQYRLAAALRKAGKTDEAYKELNLLMQSAKYHGYDDAAVYELMQLANDSMIGSPDEVPEGTPVERSYEAGQNTIDVYKVSDARTKFITAADLVVGHAFLDEPADASMPDYRAVVQERLATLKWVPAQILFHHNRFEEARPRLEAILSDHYRSMEANFAAAALVNSYADEANFTKVRELTMRFNADPPGPLSEVDPDRFQGTLEGATFQIAQEQGNAGLQTKEPADLIAAAKAFELFLDEFPRSEFARDALYNAAFYYQQAGKVEQSNNLFESYVNKYPRDSRSKGLLFRIAGNYEQAFELERAVDYYVKLQRHPDATDSEKADAQYNISFLRVGLGSHQLAANGYESYAKKYPTLEDAEEVYWRAGEQWEEVGTDQGISFYKRYLSKYGNKNPDHAITAQFRLKELYEKKGDTRSAEKQKSKILSTFDAIITSGGDVGGLGHHAAAAVAFDEILSAYDSFAKDELIGNEDKDMAMLTEDKPAELKEFSDQAQAFVRKFKDFEYLSGALYYEAAAVLDFADLGLSIQCPKGMGEEHCWAYEDLLQESVFPQYYEMEEQGIARMQEVIDVAKKQKRHSRFIDMAQEALNSRRPADYPALKHEILGESEATMPMPLRPRKITVGESQ